MEGKEHPKDKFSVFCLFLKGIFFFGGGCERWIKKPRAGGKSQVLAERPFEGAGNSASAICHLDLLLRSLEKP